MLAKYYFRTYNLPVTISRCSNNYGPYQSKSLIQYVIDRPRHDLRYAIDENELNWKAKYKFE